MKAEMGQCKEMGCVSLLQIVRAESRKVRDTQIARIIFTITVLLTLLMFIVSIFLINNVSSWTDIFGLISAPATTVFGIIFILHICEEWTRGTALITYTFVPARAKIFWAKFIVLICGFVGMFLLLFSLSIIAAICNSGSSGLDNEVFSELIKQGAPLLVNLLLAFSLSVVFQETTIAIGLYFIIPPITVLMTQLPEIGRYLKWFSLEHSSSIFIAGATGVTSQQYFCSLVVWIVIPCIIGLFRWLKQDIG